MAKTQELVAAGGEAIFENFSFFFLFFDSYGKNKFTTLHRTVPFLGPSAIIVRVKRGLREYTEERCPRTENLHTFVSRSNLKKKIRFFSFQFNFESR